MKDSMLEYVLSQLEIYKGQWATVAEETGVSKRTIEKIFNGDIADPRVAKLEKLAGYFRGRGRAAPSDRRARAQG